MRRLLRLILLILIVVGCGFLWRTTLSPFLENGMNTVFTQPIPGGERAFDPIASFSVVQEFAGADAQLVNLSINFVGSNGTVDFGATSYMPNVTYEFMQPTTRPENAPPVGAGGSLTDRWFQEVTIRLHSPNIWRTRSTSGGGVRTTVTYLHRGMERDVDDPRADVNFTPLDTPRCPLADLWQVALDDEAPADAVAYITYDSDGYEFFISGTPFRYEFTSDCELRE